MKRVEIEKDIKDMLRCYNNALKKIDKERHIIVQLNRELQRLVNYLVGKEVEELESLPLEELEKGRNYE